MSKKATKRTAVKKKKRHIIRNTFLILCLIALVSTVILVGYYYSRVPSLNTTLFEYSQNAIIYDRTGQPYQNLQGEENRQIVSIETIPIITQDAFIAIEDKRFYQHHGVDIYGTGRAIIEAVTNRNLAGSGGSTITQQLIKQTHLTSERSIERKLDEWVLATRLEEVYSKQQILEAYLNKINFHGAEGIQAAARKYFGIDASQLNLSQSAILAAIPNSPSYFDPYTYDENKNIIYNEVGQIVLNPNNKERAKLVIERMLDQNYITPDQAASADAEIENNGGVSFNNPNSIYSYFTDAIYEEVRDGLSQALNMSLEDVVAYMNTSGLKIYSTVDPQIQHILEEKSQDPNLIPAPSDEAVYASEVTGTTIQPELGITIINNEDGSVLGIVGGRENNASLTLNRARVPYQTGSSTKPLTVYTPGLDNNNFSLATVYNDAPIEIDGWRPQNSDGQYRGPLTVREGIVNSINTIATQAFMQEGLEQSLNYATKLHLTITDEDKNPAALALGGYHTGQTTVQMASAFSCIARGGDYIKPYFFTRVEDRNGNILLSNYPNKEPVFSEQACFLITDVLKQACTQGTARINVPSVEVAGKTGTTDELVTAWFCGYSPDYSIAVYNGYDLHNVDVNGESYPLAIGTAGGDRQGPAGMFESIMNSVPHDPTKAKFIEAKNIDKVIIDKSTGKVALPNSNVAGIPNRFYQEYFIHGTEPNY